jgi:hypothetical protein
LSRKSVLRRESMRKMRTIRLALLVCGLSIWSAAQTTTPTPAPSTPAPAPAFGQNAPVLNPENPPVTGLDEPGLDLKSSSRSFVSPAIQVSESADTNGQNQLGNPNGLESITRVLGALDLQQFWPKSDLFLEYLGGGAFYGSPYQVKQLQAAGLEAVNRWRTGQVTLRDAFSYLPDGSFQTGFGGVPGLGLANGGGLGTGETGGGLPGSHLFGTGQAVGVGAVPRLSNTAILDGVQAINPVSAITVAGGFSNAHYYDPTNTLVNSDELTVEGGYSRLLNRHDQIGAVYAFQLFQFPQVTGGQIYIHIVNFRYSHNITGKLRFVGGIGPQYTELEAGGYFKNWSVSARAQLRYKLGHAALVASYEKYTSAGSGLFFGANVQAARLGYTRPIGRTWDFYADLGYSHNSAVQNFQGVGANGANSYNDGSAGAIFRKHIGRTYDFFAAYRFSEVAFNAPPGLNPELGFGTGRISSRHVGTVGVEWHPKPTRIE